MILPKDFYLQDTCTLAKSLLGTYLVHQSPEGRTVGKIVETEAYLSDDPASHAYQRQTQRNSVMFGPAGHAYIYLIYGMHYCVNVVTGLVGVGEAVLIRALEPMEGVDLMQLRRGQKPGKTLCNGPGKLVQAMGIKAGMNGISLTGEQLYILSADSFPEHNEVFTIVTTTRIGITKGTELPYRYYIANNPYVSFKVRKVSS